jgi:hypothetical protein
MVATQDATLQRLLAEEIMAYEMSTIHRFDEQTMTELELLYIQEHNEQQVATLPPEARTMY